VKFLRLCSYNEHPIYKMEIRLAGKEPLSVLTGIPCLVLYKMHRMCKIVSVSVTLMCKTVAFLEFRQFLSKSFERESHL
jgi:hypothetical protein